MRWCPCSACPASSERGLCKHSGLGEKQASRRLLSRPQQSRPMRPAHLHPSSNTGSGVQSKMLNAAAVTAAKTVTGNDLPCDAGPSTSVMC